METLDEILEQRAELLDKFKRKELPSYQVIPILNELDKKEKEIRKMEKRNKRD